MIYTALLLSDIVDEDDYDVLLWVYLLLFVMSIVGYFVTRGPRKKKEAERKAQMAAAKEREQKALEERKRAYDGEIAEIQARYGVPDKIIALEEDDINRQIIVFGRVNRLLLFGKDMPLGNILNCTLSDDFQIENGIRRYQSQTRTDDFNMLRRASLGNRYIGKACGGKEFTGDAGAIIGAVTARRNTQTTVIQENDKIIHDYTVLINVRDLANPVVRIHLGKDGTMANEIIGLMNVITSGDKR